MNGAVVVLIAAIVAVPLTLSILWFDMWMSRREYQRRIRGDEVQRYADARAAIARAQLTHPAYKHRRPRKDNHDH